MAVASGRISRPEGRVNVLPALTKTALLTQERIMAAADSTPVPAPQQDLTREEIAILEVRAGHLHVDDEGGVWRLTDRRGGSVRALADPIRIDRADRAGYRYFKLKYNGRRVTVLVHRFVWTLHHGRIPEGLEPNHEDGNKGNNRIDNLKLLTHSENLRHAHRVIKAYAGYAPVIGLNAVLNSEIAREIRALWATGEWTQPQLGKRYKVSQVSISKIVNNKVYREAPAL